MVRALTCLLALLVLPFAAPYAQRFQAAEGLWLTEDRDGVVAIRPCGAGPDLCGWIVGNMLAPGEKMPLDVNGHPHCHLQIMFGMHEIDPGVWDGKIRDPRDGQLWSARIRVDEAGRLRLRGYILIPLLGSTQTWTRWPGRVTPECKMVPSS